MLSPPPEVKNVSSRTRNSTCSQMPDEQLDCLQLLAGILDKTYWKPRCYPLQFRNPTSGNSERNNLTKVHVVHRTFCFVFKPEKLDNIQGSTEGFVRNSGMVPYEL